MQQQQHRTTFAAISRYVPSLLSSLSQQAALDPSLTGIPRWHRVHHLPPPPRPPSSSRRSSPGPSRATPSTVPLRGATMASRAEPPDHQPQDTRCVAPARATALAPPRRAAPLRPCAPIPPRARARCSSGALALLDSFPSAPRATRPIDAPPLPTAPPSLRCTTAHSGSSYLGGSCASAPPCASSSQGERGGRGGGLGRL